MQEEVGVQKRGGKMLRAIILVEVLLVVHVYSRYPQNDLLFREHAPVDRRLKFSSNGEPEQEWAYVTVRPKAHMFYWLYHTTHPAGTNQRPLVMWLQGGPGGSSTGFGNFEEIGPLNVQLQPRNTTWLSEVSLLFVDNPVGTGYSYVEDDSAFTTDVQMIAADLVTLFKAFLDKSPGFQTIPFYIFSESYGGKMAAAFSQALHKAIQAGDVKSNFRGFAMGDSWISPIDSVMTWAPYLYTNSLVDRTGLDTVSEIAKKTQQAVQQGRWDDATGLWSQTESVVEGATHGVNFYNILKWGEGESYRFKQLPALEQLYLRHVARMQAQSLDELMNGPIRKKLKIIPKNVTWGGQSGQVFAHQSKDFMKPVAETVDQLIQNTSLQVVVFNGQLDLIVDTPGTEAWVYRLTIAEAFRSATRTAITIDNIPQAFVKKAKNFSFYWILDAGHMIPADNGPAALEMVRRIVSQTAYF